MNLLNARVVLRVRSVADVVDLTVPYCLRGFRLLGPLILLVLGPAFSCFALLHHAAGWTWDEVWLGAAVAGGFLQAPFVLAAGELLFNPPERSRLRTLFTHLLRRAFAFMFAHLTSRLLLAMSVVGVITWPMAGCALLFTHEAALLEGASGPGALVRSRRLVVRHNAGALGLWLITLFCPLVCIFFAEVLGQAVVNTTLSLGQPVGDLFSEGGSLYALAGFFLSLPLTAAARFLKYVDIRTRKEGWDIQLRFMAIAAKASSGGGESRAA